MTRGTEKTQQLCICADDFGMSRGINAAVLDLLERGNLGAVSCLVHRAAWRPGLLSLRCIGRERADVGLHLDLTPPLATGDEEPGLGPLLWRTFTRTASRRRLQRAIAGQLSRFEDDMGRAPAFVDGHRHVHQLPVVRQLLMEELARRYAASPPWLRNTRPRTAPGAGMARAHLIHALGGRGLTREAAGGAVPISAALLGVYDFTGGYVGYRRRLLAWLAAARTGDVLMCHPSIAGAPATPHEAARVAEYAVLAAMAFPWVSPEGGAVAMMPLSRLSQRGGI